MPFYDDDIRVLFLTGKGDGNIRYYEFVDEAPYVYLLAEHRTNVSTKGADMLPKRSCNVMKCEVARFLKLTSDSVEPLSFIVPRKSEAFQDDIFPDTIAGVPSLTADEFFAGANSGPKKMSLDPAKSGAAPKVAAPSTFKAPAPAPVAAVSGGAGATSPAPAPAAAHSPAPVTAHSPSPAASSAKPHATGTSDVSEPGVAASAASSTDAGSSSVS